MVTFKIIEGHQANALAAKVNTFLGRGWKLHGSTFVQEGMFYQAMTLTHRKDKKPE